MESERRNNRLVMIGECFRMSMTNIMNNRVRSFLTILGILIGVTAVIALITTVNGFGGSLTSTFSSLGAGTLNVSITGSDLKSGLDESDIQTLLELDCVDGITPSVSLRSRVSRGGNYETNISVSGKNAYYFRKTPGIVKRGRALNVIDEEYASRVCLISDDMVTTLFYGEDPVGNNVFIDGLPFLVVGVINGDTTANISDMMAGNPDFMIPYTTALKMNNENLLTSFSVYLKDGADSETAASEIENALDVMFSYEDDCFTVTTMSGIEDVMDNMLSMVSTLLAGIASIALIVGGIGIMNMMLTTVSERTAEIGLKKALGAHSWHIQLQFLIESFMLSMIGGLIGILLGLLLSMILSEVLGTTFVVSTGAIILGVSFSAAVGIIFGWAPARKASRLNPIDALRSM